jgi:hypothetical protein
MKLWTLIFLTFLKLGTFGMVGRFTFNEQCKKATEIFTGRVVKLTVIKEENSEDRWKFRTFKIQFITDKVWKGTVLDTMTCIAAESFCSPNIYELDKNYLVYSESGQITLGSGRSGDLQLEFIRADLTKLSLRYLFRRPNKSSPNTSLTMTDGPRQPITAPSRQPEGRKPGASQLRSSLPGLGLLRKQALFISADIFLWRACVRCFSTGKNYVLLNTGGFWEGASG